MIEGSKRVSEMQFRSRVHMDPLFENTFYKVKSSKKISIHTSGHSMFTHKFQKKETFFWANVKKKKMMLQYDYSHYMFVFLHGSHKMLFSPENL
jgi:hypothetical protein